MTRLTWSPGSDPRYETGISNVVIYVGSVGIPWSGVKSIVQSQSSSEDSAIYMDGSRYWDFVESKEYEAVMSAFSPPLEFYPCFGYKQFSPGFFLTKQPKTAFGMSYRTNVGASGYKLHIVYNLTATLAKNTIVTMSNSPTPNEMEWNLVAAPPFSTDPTTYKPTAHLVVDSTRANSTKLGSLEGWLYGTVSTNPSLLTQDLVKSILT